MDPSSFKGERRRLTVIPNLSLVETVDRPCCSDSHQSQPSPTLYNAKVFAIVPQLGGTVLGAEVDTEDGIPTYVIDIATYVYSSLPE
jgi:hypothetical protein